MYVYRINICYYVWLHVSSVYVIIREKHNNYVIMTHVRFNQVADNNALFLIFTESPFITFLRTEN